MCLQDWDIYNIILTAIYLKKKLTNNYNNWKKWTKIFVKICLIFS